MDIYQLADTIRETLEDNRKRILYIGSEIAGGYNSNANDNCPCSAISKKISLSTIPTLNWAMTTNTKFCRS